jgi:hypothetical protein
MAGMLAAAALMMMLFVDVSIAFVLPAAVSVRSSPQMRHGALARFPSSSAKSQGRRVGTLCTRASLGSNGKKDEDQPPADDSVNSALFASLRARQDALKSEERVLEKRWRSGQCTSHASLFLDDWVSPVFFVCRDWARFHENSMGG